VHLPQGSRLQGGTVTTALAVSGSTANPVISGPVRLNNTQLAGFDLGSKLQALSSFTGGRISSATGPGTTIRSLSMNVREEGGAIRTDNVALDVAGVGTATGAGGVSAGGALNYNMILKLTGLTVGSGSGGSAQPNAGGTAGLVGSLAGFIPGGGAGGALGGAAGGVLKSGIPVAIGGTTSNPTFSPNVAGLATAMGTGAAKQLLKGQQGNQKQANPLGNALGGLFGKHQ
jgi:AsmA protein